MQHTGRRQWPIGISDLDHESEIMLIFVALFNLKRYETDS